MTAILLCNNSYQTINTKMEIHIATGNVILTDFGQVYHSVCSERSSAATPAISTLAGSYSSAPRYWICSISSATGTESNGTSRALAASAYFYNV